LRQWKQQFHEEREADDELATSGALARALLAQGKEGEALREMKSSQNLADKSQNLLVRLQYELQSARVLLASDHREAARAGLARVSREAGKHGFLGVELEAMLSSAELEEKLQHKEQAQRQMALVEHLARDKGFGLIALKAAALRGQA
jgi:hypothetical protein